MVKMSLTYSMQPMEKNRLYVGCMRPMGRHNKITLPALPPHASWPNKSTWASLSLLMSSGSASYNQSWRVRWIVCIDYVVTCIQECWYAFQASLPMIPSWPQASMMRLPLGWRVFQPVPVPGFGQRRLMWTISSQCHNWQTGLYNVCSPGRQNWSQNEQAE